MFLLLTCGSFRAWFVTVTAATTAAAAASLSFPLLARLLLVALSLHCLWRNGLTLRLIARRALSLLLIRASGIIAARAAGMFLSTSAPALIAVPPGFLRRCGRVGTRFLTFRRRLLVAPAPSAFAPPAITLSTVTTAAGRNRSRGRPHRLFGGDRNCWFTLEPAEDLADD